MSGMGRPSMADRLKERKNRPSSISAGRRSTLRRQRKRKQQPVGLSLEAFSAIIANRCSSVGESVSPASSSVSRTAHSNGDSPRPRLSFHPMGSMNPGSALCAVNKSNCSPACSPRTPEQRSCRPKGGATDDMGRHDRPADARLSRGIRGGVSLNATNLLFTFGSMAMWLRYMSQLISILDLDSTPPQEIACAMTVPASGWSRCPPRR